MRQCIRDNRNNNVFSKDQLMNQEKVLAFIDCFEAFLLKGNVENICNFIMAVTALAKEDGESNDLQFMYCKDGNSSYSSDFFMNTMGCYIDLCANLDYLEEVKKVLIPLQLDFEQKCFNGEKFPEYSFIAFEDGQEKIYSNYPKHSN